MPRYVVACAAASAPIGRAIPARAFERRTAGSPMHMRHRAAAAWHRAAAAWRRAAAVAAYRARVDKLEADAAAHAHVRAEYDALRKATPPPAARGSPPAHICTETGLTPATRTGPPPAHICTETGLTPCHRNWATPAHICTETGLTPRLICAADRAPRCPP